jgi:tetratricopeptide (TPR) repeat protein
MRLPVFLVTAAFTSSTWACLWDRDTVATELKGMPEMQEVIAGRFERYPDLYYQVRLDRIEKAGAKITLDEHFDAAVASDRLKKHDQAIAWIKRLDLELTKVKLTEERSKEMAYKRAANLGTFYIHRGFPKGEEGIPDLKKGMALIEESIQINPDAHFGREKVQAEFVKAYLAWELGEGELAKEIPLTRKEVQKGTIGLMVLGNAWQSQFAWRWLASTLETSDGHMAQLLRLKSQSLPDQWKQLPLPEPLNSGHIDMVRDSKRLKRAFQDIKANGEQWWAHREEFILTALKSGKHPDTHPEFWNGYKEIPPVKIEDTFLDKSEAAFSNPRTYFIGVPTVLIAAAICAYIFLNRKPKSNPRNSSS